MKYLRSYVYALAIFSGIYGAAYMVINFVMSGTMAQIFVAMALLSSLAGPITEKLRK
jgi:hypothetical protein